VQCIEKKKEGKEMVCSRSKVWSAAAFVGNVSASLLPAVGLWRRDFYIFFPFLGRR
jgi:hypothetical protein